ATKAALLEDLRLAVDDALANGLSISEFRKRFDQIVAQHGWSYNGSRGWRTRVIYDNNLRSAHMAGRWQQIQRVKKERPYLQYRTAGDSRVRPQHRVWDRLTLTVDDKWWDTHYPPNGWNCRCSVRTLSQREMEREGLTVDQAPPLDETERIDPGTGQVLGWVPKGIDPGWNFNVGKAWLGPDIAFGRQIMAMPKPMRDAALENAQALAPRFEAAFAPWVNQVMLSKQPVGEVQTVGYLQPAVVDALIDRGFSPDTAVITVGDKEIAHLIRDMKGGKHLPADMIRALPSELANPSAILWDKQDPAALYVFDVAGDSRHGKLVVRINFYIKGRTASGQRFHEMTNSVRSGGLVYPADLRQARYEVIEGQL
ncbi:MAG: phage minor head protein, partial [Gammaproteobacteria bacterium]|nr:phage minor head protein [Gammaproteobacteria bacterium]